VLLLKRRPLAHTMAPAFLVFLILTGVPILITPIVQATRHEAAAWGVVAPIGTLTTALFLVLWWVISTVEG
jgi:hypothetical protein